VPQDDAKAFGWFQKAAAQGYAVGQSKLGNAYLKGVGVNSDLVYAYAWLNLAAAQGLDRDDRDIVAARLTAEQRAEGQRLASNWKQGDVLLGESVAQTSQPSQNRLLTKRSNGTAFAVSTNGYALTNFHVVKSCDEMRIAGRTESVKVVSTDSVNDLALLQISGEFDEPAQLIADPTKLRQGEDIIVFGYPLNSVLSSGGNLTPGTVSALTGLGNNTNQIQITAPIQPGSSGSPVLDREGSVVAVVSMKLDDIKSARVTGSIPQNVNFAVNGQTVKAFLNANKVKYKTSGGLFTFEKSNADIAENISKSTVLAECWK
jgi:S1-C subfamily serine protease